MLLPFKQPTYTVQYYTVTPLIPTVQNANSRAMRKNMLAKFCFAHSVSQNVLARQWG